MSTTTLVILTVTEVVLLVVVLALYLIVLTKRLREIGDTLGTVAFGVRAVESQVSQIGPGARRMNRALDELGGAASSVAGKAERLAERR
ncbi:MAG: hypothetical protein M3N32_09155 [Actinomycetota bacterium]|nr:hypothetical protein [Actinomycetota bacterium]